MELKKNKIGLFYTSDALLAVSILLIFMLIATPILKVKTQNSEIQYDVINSLSSTKVGDLNIQSAKDLIESGEINDSSKNVLEALGELYILNPDDAVDLAEDIFANIDSEYNIGIWIGELPIYQKIKTRAYDVSPSPEYIDSASQPISGIEEGKEVTGFAARAFLSKTMNTRYYYFGGYVGDGNISILVDYDGNISSAEIELAISNNFDLYINNKFVDHYNRSTSDYAPARYIIPTSNLSSFNSGENIIEIRNASNRSSISGGFIKINYKSNADEESQTRYYFPGIKGVINIYDGFYLPGNLNSMDIYLNYTSPQNISLIIGNETVYQGNSSGQNIINLSDAYLQTQLNYAQISDRNIPIRIGMDEAVEMDLNKFGNADVVFVSDRSGSMGDPIDSSGNTPPGTLYCGGGQTQAYNSNTQRMTILKCLLKNFTTTILSGNGNNISLVSYGDDGQIDNYLTNNFTQLNSTINNYDTSLGYTCISCGINAAYEVLSNSNPINRTRFIVVMTDGFANRRGNSYCSINDVDNNGYDIIQGGQNGANFLFNGSWNELSSVYGDRDFYDVAILNKTYAFGVGESGYLYRWNGFSWSHTNNLESPLNGVDIYNSSLAFAVSGGSDYIYRWNGTTWSNVFDQNENLNDVSIYDGNLAFVVSDDGEISQWNGAVWTQVYDLENNNRDIDSIDVYENFAIAVGQEGYIYTWNGATWANSDQGNMNFTDVDIYDSSLAFAVTNEGEIYQYDGSSWTKVYDSFFDINAVSIINSSLAYAIGDSGELLLVWNGTAWSHSLEDYLFDLDGLNCGDPTSPGCGSAIQSNGAVMVANFSSYRAHQNLNATVHAVGFSIDDCAFGNNTIKALSDSGNGNWTSSSKPDQLSKWFNEIANTILEVSYNEQRSKVLGNLFSSIYPTSYIEFDYDEPSIPKGLRFSIQKKFNNESNESFELLPGDSIIEARVLSYSGPKWTDKVYLNNSLVYNLSYYGQDYNVLGDPFNIYLPKNRLNIPGKNIVNLTLFPLDVKGSLNDSIIYTVVRNITAYSDISYSAVGCVWHIKTESNGIIDIPVPSTYPIDGDNHCYFNSTHSAGYQNYDDGTETDVYILAAYSLLKQLDANYNNETDVNLEEDFFEIDTSTVTGIPFEWKTDVSVRVWK